MFLVCHWIPQQAEKNVIANMFDHSAVDKTVQLLFFLHIGESLPEEGQSLHGDQWVQVTLNMKENNSLEEKTVKARGNDSNMFDRALTL